MFRTNRALPTRRLAVPDDYGLEVSSFIGLNTFGTHSELKPGEFRNADNIDLYSDNFKSRRGSDFLNTDFLSSEPIVNAVSWHLAGVDYVITAVETSPGTLIFKWSTISETSTFDAVYALADGTTAGTVASSYCDFLVSNEVCYVFTQTQNFIIEWNSLTSAFVFRGMGLPALQPKLVSQVAGSLTGEYVYALELIKQVSGADVRGSTPWRLDVNGDVLRVTHASQAGRIGAEAASLPDAADFYDYSHVRLLRSKRLDVDASNPALPVGPFGIESELYPITTVTYAAFILAGYIQDDTVDADLNDFTVLELDQIELSPLPPGLVGCFHKNRIWVAGCPSVDTSESDVFYSNFATGSYAEQYDPLNRVFIETGDGQVTRKLISLEKDLIVIKDSKTGRVPDGDPDQLFQTLDHVIGISHTKLVGYVTSLGLLAITNDQSDCKIFDLGTLRWTTLFGSQQLSRNVRSLTKEIAAAPEYVGFLYINGKLVINRGDGSCLVLHSEQGLGWTTYTYPIETSQFMTTFDGGRRACIITQDLPILEIELEDADTDNNQDAIETAITCTWTMHRYQSNQGRDGLEFLSIDLSGTLSASARGTPYMNGLSWPDSTTATSTATIPDPLLYSGYAELTDGVYELFLKYRPIGQYIHFDWTATAPMQIRSVRFNGFVMQNMHLGFWNRIKPTQNSLQTPIWLVPGGTSYDAGDAARILSDYGILDAGGLLIGHARDITQYTVINRSVS